MGYNVSGLRPVFVQGAMRAGGCLGKRLVLHVEQVEALRDGTVAYRVYYQDADGVGECLAVVGRAAGGRLTAREV